MIELGYVSDPDEFGIHDGRDLARQLVADAYRLLIPYVNACPDCAANLLAVISGQVAESVRKEGMASIVLWDQRPNLDKPAAGSAHLRATGARTAELMAAAPRHEHHAA